MRGWCSRLLVAVCALILVPSGTLSAQIPGAPAPAASASPAPSDPLRRDSPLGTLTGFSTAVHKGDLTVAGQYMQTGGRSAQTVEGLAKQLSDLLDRYFAGTLASVSSAPGGSIADGLEANRE